MGRASYGIRSPERRAEMKALAHFTLTKSQARLTLPIDLPDKEGAYMDADEYLTRIAKVLAIQFDYLETFDEEEQP